jgi:hypothetical protein
VYGEEVAILAGDALLALAFEYVARETRGVSAERIVRVRARSLGAEPRHSSLPAVRRACLRRLSRHGLSALCVERRLDVPDLLRKNYDLSAVLNQ